MAQWVKTPSLGVSSDSRVLRSSPMLAPHSAGNVQEILSLSPCTSPHSVLSQTNGNKLINKREEEKEREGARESEIEKRDLRRE